MRIVFIQKLIDKIRGKTYKVGKNTIIVKPSYIDFRSIIGSNTCIGPYNNITKAKIGNYCSIGSYVQIGQGEHDTTQISTSCFLCEQDLIRGICEIGNDVWIGCQSIIRRGIKVGNGAVIGANSFVNKDVPDFAIVAGSPAKIIRYRFPEEKIAKINNSKYWEYDLKKAKEIIKTLTECENE